MKKSFVPTALSVLLGASLLFPTSATAETLTENLTVTSLGNTSYHSDNGAILTAKLALTVSTGFNGVLSGNLGLVLDLTGSGNTNVNRLVLGGDNTFSGGLTVCGGTVYSSYASRIGSGTVTLKEGTLMLTEAGCDVANEIVLDSFGALRPSGAFSVSGKITGDGDLLICPDGNNVRAVTISNTANDYAGITNIGGFNVPGSLNQDVGLKLGASEVLPDSTLVQIGVHYGTPNASSELADNYLDLCGFSETVAGVTGAGYVRNSVSTAGTLNIVLNGTENSLTGGVKSNNAVNLVISGDGTQNFGTELRNTSLSASGNANVGILENTTASITSVAIADDATFSVETGAKVVVSGSFTVPAWDSVNLAPGASLTVLDVVSTGTTSSIDLNGANLAARNLPTYQITNSNADVLSVFTLNGQTKNYTLKITGNTKLVLNMDANANNVARTVLDASTRLVGVEIQRGTLRADTEANFSSNPKMTCADGKERIAIDFNGGSLMTKVAWSDNYAFNLMENGGAIRTSITASGHTIGALITGVGALEIVNDNQVTLTNTQNDYQGWTYLGKTAYRDSDLGEQTLLTLGANEVLPDSTVVSFGGGTVYGEAKLNLNGKTETVAALEGGLATNASKATVVVGNLLGSGTLVMNDMQDLTYWGKISGSVNVKMTGSDSWRFHGQMTSTGTFDVESGSLILDNGATMTNLTVRENGSVVLADIGGIQNTVLNGGIMTIYPNVSTANVNVSVTENSRIVAVPSSVFLQEKFESSQAGVIDEYYQYSGALTENANEISNMDQWVNKANAMYTQSSADIWGDPSTDKSVTNVFETVLENTTDSPISIDIGKCFRNDVSVLIVEKDSGKTVAEIAFKKNGHAEFSEATLEGVVLEPGKQYVATVRASRFNRTIGPVYGEELGLNEDANDLVGVGVRLSGTDQWCGMNVCESGDWGWVDSGIRSSMTKDSTFALGTLDIAEGKTLDLNIAGGATTTVESSTTGAGTLHFSNDYVSEARAALAGNVEGNVSVGENVALSAKGEVVVGNDIQLDGGRLIVDVASGTMRVGNITGTGLIEFDMDSLAETNADAFFVLTETDWEAFDWDNIAITLSTSDISLHTGRDYALFASEFLTSDAVVEALEGPEGVWDVWKEAGVIYASLASGASSAVPEPSAWILLISGVFGLLALRKRAVG